MDYLEYLYCGDLPTPLVDGQTSWVYPSIPLQSLYISCYVTDNKLVLSYLLLRLLPQYRKKPKIQKSLSVFCNQHGKRQVLGPAGSWQVFCLSKKRGRTDFMTFLAWTALSKAYRLIPLLTLVDYCCTVSLRPLSRLCSPYTK
jgi:hypothetical protein